MGSLWDGEICRSSAGIARIPLIVLLGCGGSGAERPAMISNRTPEVVADPAHIAGRWSYRTGSSCEDAEGVGWVRFVWDGAAGHYEERGEVEWPYVTFKVEWWGTATPDP